MSRKYQVTMKDATHHGTDLALGYVVLHHQYVRDEELAGLGCPFGRRVRDIVLALGCAGGGAEVGVKGAAGQGLGPHEGVVAGAVARGIDGGIDRNAVQGARVAREIAEVLLDVAVRSCHDHLELADHPALVAGIFRVDGASPEDNLGGRGAGGVGTGLIVGGPGRVSFKVYFDGRTSTGLVTSGSASLWIIAAYRKLVSKTVEKVASRLGSTYDVKLTIPKKP